MLTASAPPLRAYTRLLSRMGWSLLAFFAMFVAAVTLTEAIFALMPSNETVRALYGLVSTLAYALPFILSGLIFRALSKKEAGKYGALLPRRAKDRIFLPAFFPLLVLAGLAANLIAAELNYYVCLFIGYDTSALYEPVYYDTPAAVALYMTTAIAPAFAEEFLFRGVVYENLRPFGKWQAVFISAMTFSLMHQNIAQLFYTFVCGIVLALMYEWTGSIWCGVFFHLFNNELAVFSESLVYGAYGEGSYTAILIWNAVIIGIGLISAAILVICGVRRVKRQKSMTTASNPASAPASSVGSNDSSNSIFGADNARDAAESAATEVWEAPMDTRGVIRGLRSPGMLTYIIYALSTVLIDYLAVLFVNAVDLM